MATPVEQSAWADCTFAAFTRAHGNGQSAEATRLLDLLQAWLLSGGDWGLTPKPKAEY